MTKNSGFKNSRYAQKDKPKIMGSQDHYGKLPTPQETTDMKMNMLYGRIERLSRMLEALAIAQKVKPYELVEAMNTDITQAVFRKNMEMAEADYARDQQEKADKKEGAKIKLQLESAGIDLSAAESHI